MEIQKFECLENEKSFLDERRNIFHSFWRVFIWWKLFFLKKNIADTTLREKCPNTESFLVRSFPHSYLSVFSPNAGKYWSEKTPYFDTFHAVQALKIKSSIFTYPTNSSNSLISVQPILSDRNVSPKSKGNFAMKRTTAVKVMAPTKKKIK